MTPLVLIPLYWVLFTDAGRLARSHTATILFLVLASGWVEGQAMHLASNSIGNLLAPWIQWTGALFVALGYELAVWAMTVNPFFSAVIRIQTDRGHHSVSEGLYRFVRHPAYAGGVVSALALPFMLDAVWALVPGLAMSVVIVIRTTLEDSVLQASLPGYLDYARRTRARLVPGLW